MPVQLIESSQYSFDANIYISHDMTLLEHTSVSTRMS